METRLKRRIRHEFVEYLKVILVIAPLFCALAAYRILLLRKFGEEFYEYGTALVNALVLSKIIMVGRYLRLGEQSEDMPLIYPTIHKSFLFTLLALVFKVLEDVTKGLLRREGLAGAFATLDIGEMLIRSVVMFFAFLPLFALWETARVLTEGKLTELFFRPRASAGIESSSPRHAA